MERHEHPRTFYLECGCYDLEHLVRWQFWEPTEEDHFAELYLQFKPYRWQIWDNVGLYKNKKGKYIQSKLGRMYADLREWMRNVWRAIKGAPGWWNADILLTEPEHLRDLSKFLVKCADRMDLTKQCCMECGGSLEPRGDMQYCPKCDQEYPKFRCWEEGSN